MLKHYYVSPKKRTKSQSSETSAASENSWDGPTTVGSDGHRRQQNGAPAKLTGAHSFRRSPHSLRSAYSLFTDDFEDWRTKCAAAAFASQQQQHYHHLQHCKTTDNMDQKRPPSGHKMQFLQFCKNYRTSNYAELRSNNSANAGYTSDSSLSASVRRWNSFHSTRGECHPNKFRRERKSTSPSLEFERQRYQTSSTTSTPSRSRQLRRGKSLATPEKLSSLSCSGGTTITTGNSNHSLILGAYFSAAAAAATDHRHASLPNATVDDALVCRGAASMGYSKNKSGHTSLW